MARTDATIILCVSDVRYLLAVAFSWCCCGCDAPSIWPVWLTINEQGHELDWLYVLCPCFPSIQARLLRLRRLDIFLRFPERPATFGSGRHTSWLRDQRGRDLGFRVRVQGLGLGFRV